MSAPALGGLETAVATRLARRIRGLAAPPALIDALSSVHGGFGQEFADDRGPCMGPQLLALARLVDVMIARGHWPAWTPLAVSRELHAGDPHVPWLSARSAHFVAHFQTAGEWAVPADTGNDVIEKPGAPSREPIARLPPGDAPEYVRRLFYWLERAYDTYSSAPFTLPLAAGQSLPLSVRLSHYTRRDGQPTGGPELPNGIFLHHDCHPDLLCSIACHELFHLFQAAQGLPDAWRSLFEGGAVLVEDQFGDGLNRYLHDAGPSHIDGPGVLAKPGKPLDRCEYHSALFWRYLLEQRSPDRNDAFGGFDAYRTLYTRVVAGGDVQAAVAGLLPGRSFARFAKAGRDLLSGETLLGNYALACRLKELGQRAPDARFHFAEEEEAINSRHLFVATEPLQTAVARVTRARLSVPAKAQVELAEYAFWFADVAADPSAPSMDLAFAASAELEQAVWQLALIGDDGALLDVIRADQPAWRRRVPVRRNAGRVAAIAVCVGAAAAPGRFLFSATAGAASPHVEITRWNCPRGQRYERDPGVNAWDWRSPDVWVAVPSGARHDRGEGVGERPLQLGIHVENRGVVAASGVDIDLHFQAVGRPEPVPRLDPDGWLPVRNGRGEVQMARALILPAARGHDWTAEWDPTAGGRPIGDAGFLCVRAEVSAPGDPNTDDKVALSLVRWH
jgi:hypothetical protein